MRLSRRMFLEIAGTTSLSAISHSVGASGPAAKKTSRPWRPAIGLNGFMSSSRTFNKKYLIGEILSWAAREGFEGVELVSNWPEGPYPDPDDKERCSALRALYDKHGLRIFAIQSSVKGRPHAPDSAERDMWLKGFERQARFARSVGCEIVGLWPSGSLGDQTIAEALAHLCDSYTKAAVICADLGMIAAFEIEPPFVFNTEEHLMRILEGVTHPAFKGIYDPSHYDQINGARGKPEELLRRVGVQRIGHVQFCDTDGTVFRGTSRHLGCGDGKLDIRENMRALWEGGYRGWFMFDTWNTEDPYDASLKGKRAMESFLATVHLERM
ncbi:sugar phosphate isomerase/epimerase [Candidatus Sumerlaeota bacterium]|nr:sugar phosphate isomerase/epimerase [Candidatus Sumerlaeota bacterium]